MKIRVVKTGEVIEISAPYMTVRNDYLFNKNTEKYEAVGGDVVIVEEEVAGHREYHVLEGQYTDFQIVPCKEAENEYHCVVLSAEDARKRRRITHNSFVELIEE